jgi:hypothetical protein
MQSVGTVHSRTTPRDREGEEKKKRIKREETEREREREREKEKKRERESEERQRELAPLLRTECSIQRCAPAPSFGTTAISSCQSVRGRFFGLAGLSLQMSFNHSFNHCPATLPTLPTLPRTQWSTGRLGTGQKVTVSNVHPPLTGIQYHEHGHGLGTRGTRTYFVHGKCWSL